MAKIKIGEVWSIRTPESYEYKPDDRQERVELIDDILIDDNGHVEDGDIISVQAVFKKTDFENTLKPYWKNRTMVTFIDEAGVEYSNVRVVYKGHKYYPKFPKYVIVTLEIWRK